MLRRVCRDSCAQRLPSSGPLLPPRPPVKSVAPEDNALPGPALEAMGDRAAGGAVADGKDEVVRERIALHAPRSVSCPVCNVLRYVAREPADLGGVLDLSDDLKPVSSIGVCIVDEGRACSREGAFGDGLSS